MLCSSAKQLQLGHSNTCTTSSVLILFTQTFFRILFVGTVVISIRAMLSSSIKSISATSVGLPLNDTVILGLSSSSSDFHGAPGLLGLSLSESLTLLLGTIDGMDVGVSIPSVFSHFFGVVPVAPGVVAVVPAAVVFDVTRVVTPGVAVDGL